MPDLRNTFSWSFSAMEDFDECRRRRFWAKYAMWGGWSESATALQRAAYRLSKMENRYSITGNAVERAVMWVLRQKQAGKNATADEAYVAAARPYLNECWRQSRQKLWQANPKKNCCLWEHYYVTLDEQKSREMTDDMIARVRQCTENFIGRVLPRIAGVQVGQEKLIAAIGAGDPESFQLGDVKVYAIPDYAYETDGMLHIHDWKSGARKASHENQVRIYGLWAVEKHGLEPGQVAVHLEYLFSGELVERTLTEADMEEARAGVRGSVEDMCGYLEGCDIKRNMPLPQEDWELASDIATCRRCNFIELCKPELDEQQGR